MQMGENILPNKIFPPEKYFHFWNCKENSIIFLLNKIQLNEGEKLKKLSKNWTDSKKISKTKK